MWILSKHCGYNVDIERKNRSSTTTLHANSEIGIVGWLMCNSMMAPSLLSSLLFIFTSAVAGEVNVTTITLGQVSFYGRRLAEEALQISCCLSVPGR